MRCATAFAAMLFVSVSRVFAADPRAERQEAEVIKKADALFTNRYKLPAGKELRFDEDTESGPADQLIYWFKKDYVVALAFAPDGSLAQVELLPEVLLYSDDWTDVPDAVKLEKSDVRRILDDANQLRSMGSPVEIHEPPDACFQSGPNLSCGDAYENAAVSEYCNVGYGRGRAERISPRQIGVAYQQLINGSVSEIKVFKEEYRLKVGNFWYIVSKDDNSDFLAKVAVGSMVSLTTYGCAGNELACDAAPTKH